MLYVAAELWSAKPTGTYMLNNQIYYMLVGWMIPQNGLNLPLDTVYEISAVKVIKLRLCLLCLCLISSEQIYV